MSDVNLELAKALEEAKAHRRMAHSLPSLSIEWRASHDMIARLLIDSGLVEQLLTERAVERQMTAEELAAIDAWLDDLEPGCDGFYIETRLVRALRDEVTRLLEIVRAVANFDREATEGGAYACSWCGAMYDGIGDAPAKHSADCRVTQARALVARLEGGVDKPRATA